MTCGEGESEFEQEVRETAWRIYASDPAFFRNHETVILHFMSKSPADMRRSGPGGHAHIEASSFPARWWKESARAGDLENMVNNEKAGWFVTVRKGHVINDLYNGIRYFVIHTCPKPQKGKASGLASGERGLQWEERFLTTPKGYSY